MTRMAILSVVLCLAVPAAAHDEPVPPDLQGMVDHGMAEALAARLRTAPHPQGARLLAQAHANQARSAPDARARQEAYARARCAHEQWISELDLRAAAGDLSARVQPALARVELAGILLFGYAAEPLGELDLSAGQIGDRALVCELLEATHALCQAAEVTLQPLLTDLPRFEEHLLAAGVYDALLSARIELLVCQGWTAYFRGRYGESEALRRNRRLGEAEHHFHQLLQLEAASPLRPHVRMALGMTQRELGRYPEATRYLQQALAETSDGLLTAQIRCELARCHVAARRFEEARATLAPLVQEDLATLDTADQAARFYYRLAHLEYANSYLIEAGVMRRAALSSPVRDAIQQRARDTRATGLQKLRSLAALGPPWPLLVRVYVADSLDLDMPFEELLPIELYYTASVLIDRQDWAEALHRLERAAAQPDLAPDLMGDVLFERGRCEYQLGRPRDAAATFDRLATRLRSHSQAPQAAMVAYQLWGQIAEHSGRPEDYQSLAATLRNLIASFADHPNRTDALWLLPVALQLGGAYEEAADAFAMVPADSPHGAEAQFRRVICQRYACDAARATLSAAQFATRARETAQKLQEYADQALRQAPTSPRPEAWQAWAGQARLAAAELLCSPGVEAFALALQLLDGFEDTFPATELRGRVLAVRMRAYHGLRDFGHATEMLQDFLADATPDTVRPTLTALANGIHREVERLSAAERAAEAQALAADALVIFEALEQRLHAANAPDAELVVLQEERARLLHLAGRYGESQAQTEELLRSHPRRGSLRHLHALILTARLDADASDDRLRSAQQAWEVILADPGLRQSAPDRYWEARYQWLALHLRRGQAAEVAESIFQESRWLPDLGGPTWHARLAELYRAAGGQEPLVVSDTAPAGIRPEGGR